MENLYTKLKLSISLLALFCLVSNVKSQTTVPAGNVSGTWTTSGSPYNVTGDITIANSTTLTINSGVTVSFKGHYKFNVQGRLLANGTSSSRIIITAVNTTTGWKGIRFDYTSSSNDSSLIKYCNISYGNTSGSGYDGWGGGIFVRTFSKLRIQNCIISNNTAYYYGGGIACTGNAAPKIYGNEISNNTAKYGGGIECDYSSPDIRENIINNNTVIYGGGAIECYSQSSPYIWKNKISNNTAGYYGGAIYMYNSSPQIINNLLCNNNSNSTGGGLYVGNYSNPYILGNTIANNHANSYAGGIYIYSASLSPVIKNCIIWGNSGSSYSQIYPTSISSISYSDVQGGYNGTGNINSNPNFTSPTTGSGTNYNGLSANWSLQSSSNCIDNGSNSALNDYPAWDLGGNIRVDGEIIDMGAYEYISSILGCGTINTNTTWSNSVLVTCNITVANGKTLTITPGTKVKFLGPYTFNIQGRLLAVGKTDSFINLYAYDTAIGWSGISFSSVNTSNDTSKIEYCMIKHSKKNFGGALYINNSSKVLIRSNQFSNNYASYYGGAIYLSAASPRIINNLIVNNTGYYYGGGIYISGATSAPQITNNTIANNYSYYYGAGIYRSSGSPIIRNNIIWGNYTTYNFPQYRQLYPVGLSNVTYNDIDGIGTYSGTGNIRSNPKFKNPSVGTGHLYYGLSGDWALQETSPCIDVGTPSVTGLFLPPVGLKNKVRVFNSRVDMGAYEDKSTLNVCGTISSNTVWDANNVIVNCDVIVNRGVTLTINSGTKVKFNGQYKLEVKGNLIAEGTAYDTIRFYAITPSTGWKGIILNDPYWYNYNQDSTKIRYCEIRDVKDNMTSYSSKGGGISLSYQKWCIISNCRIHDNHLTGSNYYYSNGGGIYSYQNYGIIENNIITNNSSDSYGGGLYYSGGAGIVRNNIITNNTCDTRAGGVYLGNTEAKFTNNIVANNTALGTYSWAGGGGIYYSGTQISQSINNTIVNNTAKHGGGVLFSYDAHPLLINNTIGNNHATSMGGGIHCVYNSDPVIKNTIIYGNTATDSGSQVCLYDIASDPKIYYSDIQEGTAGFAGNGARTQYANVYQNNIDVNPSFTNPSSGTGTSYNGLGADWTLQTASQCINTGTPDTMGLNMPSTDMGGNDRVYNGRIDIGAFENQQDITACGTISSSTVWDADTIKVTCDIIIPNNVTLTVMPGTFVEIQGQYKILVQGRILALGTANEMITFSVNDTSYFSNMDSTQGGWGGMHFNSISTSIDSSRLIFCRFKFGKATGSNWTYDRGGAMNIYNSSKILISNCIFSNNRAKYEGGAIFLESSNPVILNNVFSNNSAFGSTYTTRGGAIYIDDCASPYSNNTFCNNKADYGGALYIWASSSIFKNNIFYGNDQTGYSNNSSYGSQIYISGSTPDFFNCNIEHGKNNIWGSSYINSYVNNISVDPEFLSPSSGSGALYNGLTANWSINPTSPCINAGINVIGLVSIDLAGNLRKVADTLDIGAFESQISRRFITSHPSNQTACENATATFSVSTSVPVSYQWQKDSINIQGTNSSILIIDTVSLNNTGSYVCILSNLYGSVYSNPATLTVNTAPVIDTNPLTTESCLGQSATFSVVASGTPPLSYQWYNSNGMVSGGTNSTFTILSVSANDASTYFCIVTNNCGFATSSGAALTINSAPTVTSIPSNTSVCEGSNISFTTSATGTSPIHYQWYSDNGIIVNDTGVQYQIATVDTSYAGYYYCKATNICGSDSTNTATLNVNTSPTITSQSSGSTICEGQSMTFSITALGTSPISYQWYFGGSIINGATNNTYTLNSVSTSDAGNYFCRATNTCGMAQSTNISLTINQAPSITTQPVNATKCVGQSITFSLSATGTTPILYQWYDNNGAILNATNNSYTIATVSTSDAGYYYCIVTNSCGSAQSNNVVLTVNEAPNITSQTSNSTNCEGQSITFIVSATGTAPITYQWYDNNGAISGAVNNTHTINSISTSDAGTYYCIATNSCGNDQSNNINLSVNVSPTILTQSLNANRCVGQSMTFSITASGTSPITYQWYLDTSAIASATNNTYTINSVTTNDAGNYYCVATNICDVTQSNSKTLSVNTSPSITSQSSNSTRCIDQSMTFAITANGTSPITYQWYDNNGSIANATNNTYTINSLTTSDAGNYYCIATNSCGTDQGNNINLTVNVQPSITAHSSGSGKCIGQNMTFSITASGTAPINYQWYNNNGSISNATNNSYTINSVTTNYAGNYYCIASNSCGNAQSAYISFTVNVPPSIITQSDSAQICAGQNTVLSLTANGTSPFTYQWYYENVAITGVENSFYMINSITSVNSGNYYCEVTNVCGTFQSKNINLVVNEPISIILQSDDSSRCVGESMTFIVNAIGTVPITYEWYYGTIAIPGATNNSYKIDSVLSVSSGSFNCKLTNSCGNIVSTSKILTVHSNPAITLAIDTTFCKGGSITLTAGSGYFCEWNTGSTNPQLSVMESGDYHVRVEDIYGCQGFSDTAHIEVVSPYPFEEICVVTIDPPTGKNLIAWERTSGQGIIGYNIYKESTIGGVYQLIGTKPFDSVSVLVDYNSDPKKRADRYRITAIDSCGNESAPSQHHKTIHLTASEGTSGENNLNWSHYEGISFNTYKIYRGTSPSNMTQIDLIQNTLNSFSDQNPPSGLVFYQVSAVKNDTCYPTLVRGITSSGPYSQSLSNLKDYSNSPGNYLATDPSSLILNKNAGSSDTISVFTNAQYWSVSTNDEWLGLIPNIADGILSITALTENTISEAREGIVIISGDGVSDLFVTVNQLGTWGSVGIKDEDYSVGMKIYPNPFNHSTHIILPEYENHIDKLEIYDISGKLARTVENINGNRYELFKDGLAEGLYFIRVIADRIYFDKVIVK